MSGNHDSGLAAQVVNDVAGESVQVMFFAPDLHWTSHVRFDGSSGHPCHLLTTSEWLQVQFAEPRCSLYVVRAPDDDVVLTDLSRLVRVCVEYVNGGGRVEYRLGLSGRRRILVVRTSDGEWRVGRWISKLPR